MPVQYTIIAHVLHLTIFITYFLEKQEYINVCKNLFEIHLFINWMQLVQLLWKDAANEPRAENTLQRERREREMKMKFRTYRQGTSVRFMGYSIHCTYMAQLISKFIICRILF